MERLNDWVLALLASCEFWIAGGSGFLALAVYGILKKMGFADWAAVLVAILVFFAAFFVFRGMFCA